MVVLFSGHPPSWYISHSNPWEGALNYVGCRRCVWVLLYIDYPADNNKMSWQDMLAWLRQKRWQSLGFGGITYLALMIPVVNVLMMPAAVAGATLFWVREKGDIRVTKPSSQNA